MFMPGWFSHAVIFNKEKQEWMEERYNVVGPGQNWDLLPRRLRAAWQVALYRPGIPHRKRCEEGCKTTPAGKGCVHLTSDVRWSPQGRGEEHQSCVAQAGLFCWLCAGTPSTGRQPAMEEGARCAGSRGWRVISPCSVSTFFTRWGGGRLHQDCCEGRMH